MKRMIASLAAAAAIGGAGFAAGRSCHPRIEGPMGIESVCRISTSENDSARFVELMAGRAIRQTSPVLRHELGAGTEGEAEIKYLISVSESGSMKVIGSESSCAGAKCPGQSELPELIGILLASEFAVAPRTAPCTLELKVSVPPARPSEGRPMIIIPPEGRGIEL